MFTDAFIYRHTAGDEFIVYNILKHGSTATTASAGLGLSFHIPQRAASAIDGADDIAFGDIVAGADGSSGGQGGHAECCLTSCSRHNQALGVGR